MTANLGASPLAPQDKLQTQWSMPRLNRERRWVGGVADALAVEVGVEPMLLRAGFVALGLTGYGVILYALLWVWLRENESSAPYEPTVKGADPTKRHIGVVCVLLGLFMALVQLPSGPWGSAWVAALAILFSGVVVIWSRSSLEWALPSELRRYGSGMVLVALGLFGLILLQFDIVRFGQAVVLLAVLAALVAVLVGPWLWRAATALNEERRRRIRADERAAVAAHLHDSVLQTLTLIQRNATDPTATVSLARRQERELREWLYAAGSTSAAPEYLRGALAGIVSEIEQLYRVPVELVVVGDCAVDEAVGSLLQASREAMANAARHSGADRIDVFAEAEAGRLEVFVRDKGKGFDRDAVSADRHGVADSIEGRMARAGGTATVTSDLGQGTEIELSIDCVDSIAKGSDES